jgi:hypothetical protein
MVSLEVIVTTHIDTCATLTHLVLLCGSASSTDVLWDNVQVPPELGLSHFAENPRRSIMDDFIVPGGESWSLEAFELSGTWLHLPPGSGESIGLAVYQNVGDPNGGEPGELCFNLLALNYHEETTGEILFSREVVSAWVEVDPVVLDPGTYWIDMHMLSTGTFLQGATYVFQHSPVWVRYEDVPPVPRPGFDVHGFASDASWRLSGTVLSVSCRADVDGNSTVDLQDLVSVLSAWGANEPCPPFVPQDVDRDCQVGLGDLLGVLSAWGPCLDSAG